MTQKHAQAGRALRRTALSLAIGLSFSTLVLAQSADGSLFGQTSPKAQITVQNLETGTSRTIQADGNGGFALTKLPPGRYKVSAGGKTQDVSVAIGSGTEVKFDDLQSVVVSQSRTRKAIDVSSTESNTVFSLAEIQALPVARNPNAVALLAPSVVQGDQDFTTASLPAIGGASVGENGYYINGFDVTNIRNFLSYANLPFDAVEQQQIKTGGYGAEYGRSLGGVISLVTKRGTNTWKGGISTYWSPENLRAQGQNVVDKEPSRPNSYYIFAKDDKRSALSANAYLGGPIIKDKLFVFGLVEAQKNTSTNFTQEKAIHEVGGLPNGMIKVDFLPTADHRIEYTGINNKQLTRIYDYDNAKPFATTKDGNWAYSEQASGGSVNMLKYTGYLTDDLTVSAMVGRVWNMQPKTVGARRAGLDCPVVLETTQAEIGCWVGPFPGVGDIDPNAPDDSDERKAGRLDLEYTLGAHTIRAGYDGQRFYSSAAGGSDYTGGVYWRYFTSPNGSVNGVANMVAPGGQYVRARVSKQTSGSYEVDNSAYYIEDSWKMNRNWLLYGGLRWETFDNKNGDGISFVKASNLVAPRLGATWNVHGDSSLKIYGTAGRYFIPVASNTNIRATRGEIFAHHYYTFNGRDPRTQAPLNLSASIGIPQITGDGRLPDPRTIADTQLKPMSQDEYIIGFQKALAKNFAVGMKYTHRKVNNGMDDFCNHGAIARWAKDSGYNHFDPDTLAECMIMNPGNDLTLAVDVNNDGNLKTVTIPARYLDLARYERKYDAVELSLDRPFDGKWGLSGSYTWSKLRGTAEGYVQSNINQEDAGVSQDFDHGSFTHGSKGFLPNDRRHQFKLYGNYAFDENFRMGANFLLTSGRPTSCIGFVPTTVGDFYGTGGTTRGGSGGYNTPSSYYCLNEKGESVLGQRGTGPRTPWTYNVDLSFAYVYKLGGEQKLTLQADIFNVFNAQKPLELNEVRDYSRGTTNSVPGQLSMNYMSPTSFQSPRSVRLTARYEF